MIAEEKVDIKIEILRRILIKKQNISWGKYKNIEIYIRILCAE
jgi:hypothetical protein